MPTRAVDRGRARGRRLVQDLCREIDLAARDRGLSYSELGRLLGVSGQYVGRMCRCQAVNIRVVRLAELAAVVGLDLAARAYPGGRPARDRAHAALLDRLRARLSPSLRWRTEVPVVSMAGSPDQRAWDATIAGPGWLIGIEAETHVTDLQALERRLSLKLRDGEVDLVVVLLNETMHHRQLFAGIQRPLGFDTPARSALRALGRGERPPGSAVIRL